MAQVRSLRKHVPWMALLVAALLLVSGTAFGQSNPKFVSIGTASPAGAYYPLGIAMANIWNKAIPGTHFSAQQTGGSVANMNMIHSNQIELGMANENIAWNAMQGNAPFKQKINVEGGWVLNKSYAVFVVKASSGIKTVADLKGKKVSLGAAGSSGNVIAERVLQSAGLSKGDYKPVYMGWQQSADAIADDSIDAAIMVGGQPFPAIESLAVRTPVRILSFNKAALESQKGFPLTAVDEPAGLYKTKEAGTAVLVRSIVYINPDMPADLVYQMVKAVFANIPALKAAHPSGDEAALLSKTDAQRLGLTVNPGVVKYAKEVGAW